MNAIAGPRTTAFQGRRTTRELVEFIITAVLQAVPLFSDTDDVQSAKWIADQIDQNLSHLVLAGIDDLGYSRVTNHRSRVQLRNSH